jgi:hypothetical protein
MTIYVTLTVDLNGNVSTAARAKFNEFLKGRNYTKHKLTTLWTAWFLPNNTIDSAIRYTKESVAAAAKVAGISNYEALVMPGEQKATEWKQI